MQGPTYTSWKTAMTVGLKVLEFTPVLSWFQCLPRSLPWCAAHITQIPSAFKAFAASPSALYLFVWCRAAVHPWASQGWPARVARGQVAKPRTPYKRGKRHSLQMRRRCSCFVCYLHTVDLPELAQTTGLSAIHVLYFKRPICAAVADGMMLQLLCSPFGILCLYASH